MYRPPGDDFPFWDNFQQSVENVLNYSPYVLITGDINIDLLTDHSHRIFDIMRLNGLRNVVTEPTRCCNTRQSLLDPIIISENCEFLDSFVIPIDRSISDHHGTIVFMKIPSKVNKTFKRMIWDYRNANFDRCNEYISSFAWESIITDENSMDINCENFTSKFIEFITLCVPRKEVTIRIKDKVWFNSELRKEIRKRDRLHKIARRTKSNFDINKYKKQRNHVNNMKKYAKEQFYLNANNLLDDLSNTNSKSFWSLIKRLVKSSTASNISQLKNENGDIVSDDYAKACLLNKYFCSISSIDDSNSSPPNFPNRTDATLDIFQISPSDVRDILQILKLGKASGIDSISHQMLKNTSNTVCVPLALLFNISLSKGEFPSQWKIAAVMPLFKNGDKTVVSNYRPISLLSAIGKVFERIVFKEFFNYLISNNLLYKL